MSVKDGIFRYRIITNLDCNMSPNCYFCYQPDKRKLRLDINKAKGTMAKVGRLKRATIMGGESTLIDNLPDFIKLTRDNVENDVCLVTNGILLNKERMKSYSEAGLTEVAISISSLEQYKQRREQALICKKYVPNTRINIPKCWESTGDKLVEMLKAILEDDFYVVVCEDLMGRYGEFDFEQKLPATFIKDDGHNFLSYTWNGHEFGVFAHYSKYDDTDIIISPVGNFCKWESYCDRVGNTCLR
jgi:hypothetical protein